MHLELLAFINLKFTIYIFVALLEKLMPTSRIFRYFFLENDNLNYRNVDC